MVATVAVLLDQQPEPQLLFMPCRLFQRSLFGNGPVRRPSFYVLNLSFIPQIHLSDLLFALPIFAPLANPPFIFSFL